MFYACIGARYVRNQKSCAKLQKNFDICKKSINFAAEFENYCSNRSKIHLKE